MSTEAESELFEQFDSMNVADLEDLPSFDPYPNGAHLVTIEFERKVVNDKPAVILKTTIIESQQLEDPSAAAPVAGDSYDFMYNIGNEFGAGSLKALLAPLSAQTGIAGNGALLDHCKGMQALIATKQRMDKKNDVMRCNVTSMQLI